FVREQTPFDAPPAPFKAPGRPPEAADISTVKVARETKFCIVRHSDCLLIGLETENGRYGTEHFFSSDLHFGSNIPQYGWFEEGLPKYMPLPAKKNAGPL